MTSQITRDWILSRKCYVHPKERLLRNVKVSDRGCWELQSNLDRYGYGRFKIGGRQLGAHKISYILHKGDYDQERFELMHHCDNPKCINPDHLSPATHQVNMKDCAKKGRHNKIMRNNDLTPKNFKMEAVIAFFSRRNLAISRGDKTYTGTKCKKHDCDIRLTGSSDCVMCVRDRSRNKRKTNKRKRCALVFPCSREYSEP